MAPRSASSSLAIPTKFKIKHWKTLQLLDRKISKLDKHIEYLNLFKPKGPMKLAQRERDECDEKRKRLRAEMKAGKEWQAYKKPATN